MLAQVDANLGQKDLAIQEAITAMTLMPASKDAYDGPLILQGLAQVYVWTGDVRSGVRPTTNATRNARIYFVRVFQNRSSVGTVEKISKIRTAPDVDRAWEVAQRPVAQVDNLRGWTRLRTLVADLPSQFRLPTASRRHQRTASPRYRLQLKNRRESVAMRPEQKNPRTETITAIPSPARSRKI